MVLLRLVVGKKQKDYNQTLGCDTVEMPPIAVSKYWPSARRDMEWQDCPNVGLEVSGYVRRMVRKFHVDGDAQADLDGHDGSLAGLIGGSIIYNPEPLDRPAPRNVLICCPKPNAVVTLDL